MTIGILSSIFIEKENDEAPFEISKNNAVRFFFTQVHRASVKNSSFKCVGGRFLHSNVLGGKKKPGC